MRLEAEYITGISVVRIGIPDAYRNDTVEHELLSSGNLFLFVTRYPDRNQGGLIVHIRSISSERIIFGSVPVV